MENSDESTKVLRQDVTYIRDLFSIFVYFVLGLALIYISNLLLSAGGIIFVIFGLILIFYGLSLILRVFSEFGSSLNYKKAQPYVQGLYLRKTVPVCPYLKSSYSGFSCQIEFTEKFDISKDLPKCHIESAYKAHWEEKAPNVLEKARTTTSRSSIVTYLNMLGKTKYTPALPLMQEIFKTPIISKKYHFIYEKSNSGTITTLKEDFVENFFKTNESKTTEENDEQKQKVYSDFDKSLNDLITFGILKMDGENVLRTELSSGEDYFPRWKIYSAPLVKQFAIASMSYYEDPELIPMFFDVFINSNDSKMIQLANNGLMRLKDHLEDPLLSFIDREDIPANRKSELIELAGKIKTDKIFNKLVELANSDDETLSYFALSSLGKFGSKGLHVILDVLQDSPTDLKLDSGRSTLALYPNESFEAIVNLLEEQSKISDEFHEILSSVLDEFDHSDIKKFIYSQPESEQDRIDQVFEKHNFQDNLDYFLA